MKSYRWVILGLISCALIAGGAYAGATGLMDSIFAYRSPLHASPPTPGPSLGQPITRRVVFVLIDALRLDTLLKHDVMPVLNDLRERGAWATMHSRPPSYSEPGWTVLLTGAWPDVSDGPAVNLDYDDIPTWTQDNLFSAIHRAGLKTAVSGYYWFEKLIPQSDVSASFYTPGEDDAADRQVVSAALSWIKERDYQLVLIHIDQVDYAGHHEGGPRDPRWDAAARRADSLLGEIVAALDLDQDTLFVCSDHGQIDRGGHGGQDPITLIEPFVLVGAGVKPGRYGDVQMVDVAPTLAALLGANLPASSQGRVRTEMLAFDPGQVAAIHGALQAQQGQLLEAYQSAIGRRVMVKPGDDVVAVHQAAMDAARSARLASERLLRVPLALFMILVPAVVLFRKRGRDLAWLLGGALVYVVLFNLRYAVLDGRTYSLSSVYSANELIIYSAVTTFVGLALGWLLVSLGLGAFRRASRQAAETTLGLTLVTVYLLSLPVIWSFAFDGLIATWTLPDFARAFLAFLSLIQILMVAVTGVILSGLAAVITIFARR